MMATVKMLSEHLKSIEEQHGVEIIYAVIAGSHAWNLASPDSDIDIRFIYKYPKKRYLQITQQVHDSIIKQDADNNIESMGWDVSHALTMLVKSNPNVIEIFGIEPLVCHPLIDRIKLRRDYTDPYTLCKAYCGIAKSDIDKASKSFFASDVVRGVKTTLSAARGVLSAAYAMTYGTAPPADINSLIQELEGSEIAPPNVLSAIRHLVKFRRQAQGEELGTALSTNGPEIFDTHCWMNVIIERDFTHLKREPLALNTDYIDDLAVRLITDASSHHD